MNTAASDTFEVPSTRYNERPRILIVEDERIVAEDIRECVESFGYSVIACVTSGERALEVISEELPDLVLLDINLEGNLNGTDVGRELQKWHKIPVIYITAYSDQNTLNRVKPTIPLGFILKPFDERTLRSSIELALYKGLLENSTASSADWYEQAIHRLDEALIVIDEHSRIKFMNSAAEDLIKCKFIDVHDSDLTAVVKLYCQSGSEIFSSHSAQKFLAKEGFVRLTNVMLTPHGTTCAQPVALILSTILNKQGVSSGLSLIIKAANSAGSEATQNNQQRIVLEEKLLALSELIEGLAHGINNSLSTSVGFLELMRNQDEVEKEFEQWAEMALTGCRNAAALIARARNVCSATPLHQELLDVNELAERVYKRFNKSCATNIRILFSPTPESLRVTGDSVKIEQALTNVVINAVQALPEGGTISIETALNDIPEDPQGPMGAELKPYATIVVKDNGEGIDASQLTRLFDPFYTTLKDGKVFGRGLGLTVAYGILKSHGGWINVHSVKKEGATFTLFLPCHSTTTMT